jgi:excisionase family DNA binding protein
MPRYAAQPNAPPTYLWPGEVAEILFVNVKTVNRWAKEGKLPHLRTLGGHRRYEERAIRELAASLVGPPQEVPR